MLLLGGIQISSNQEHLMSPRDMKNYQVAVESAKQFQLINIKNLKVENLI